MRSGLDIDDALAGSARAGRVNLLKLLLRPLRAMTARRAGLDLNLALQGGGAHGAFTWGVLDRLLEDTRVNIRAVSGASAGAVNAVALVDGFAAGGRAGARAKLDAVWHSVIDKARWGALGTMSDRSPTMMAFDIMTRVFTPAQLNPFAVNPLREILLAQIDFRRLRRAAAPDLYVAATDVATGTARIFSRREMTAKALLASACLPQLMQPVRIAGRVYWDGGFSSNPPLWPLLEGAGPDETLLVLLDPRTEPSVPATAPEIGARLSWFAFGQPLARELAAMERAQTTGTFGGLFRRRLRRHRLSFIEAGDAVAGLSRASKLLPERKLVLRLKEAGRAAAAAWLAQRFDGQRDAACAAPRPGAARTLANAVAARNAA
jgi:NTE family protein